MRKTLFIPFFLIASLNVFAQEIVTTIDKIANETCNYFIENKEELTKFSSNERVTKLGLQMLSLYDKYKAELLLEGIEVDVSDESSTEAFGEKVGFAMAKYCTDVLIMLAEDFPEEKEEEITFYIEGEIKNISGSEISTIAIKDALGKTQKFVWLNNFEGSDKLIYTENIVGLKVKITYKNIELYSPVLKEYIVRKQVTKIEYLQD